MLSCFNCGPCAGSFVLDPTPRASSTARRCSPSSKERNYFNEMNKDPCSLIEEVKTHLNKMGSFANTKYMDLSPEEKSFISSIAKEEEIVHPPSNALIQQLDGYTELDKEKLVVPNTIVSKNGTICSSAEERPKNGPIHIAEDSSSMNAPAIKEIFCSEGEKQKTLICSSLEDDFIEDKERDRNEAEEDKLSRKLVSDPAMLAESGITHWSILKDKPTQAIFHSFADGEELLMKKDIPEESIACVMCVACDMTENHQDPESAYDEINTEEYGEEKHGALNVAHKDYNEYYDKGVITSQSKLEHPTALYSYGISDQQRDFLFLCAGLVIQAVAFQLRSLVEVATALILLCYRAYVFACCFADTLSRAKQKLAERQKMLRSYVAVDSTRISLHKERWEAMKPLLIQGAKKMGWRCLTAAYVLAMLSALLLTSFLFSYLAVKGGATQKPIHITTDLYFDYTKAHPVASIDLFSLDAYRRTSNATKGIKVAPGRAGLRYRCNVLLTVPESDHNRKLGVFQVRSEMVSEKGEIMVKGSQPCMLLFRSNTVHYIKSMVMAIPLLTGLASETQTLRLQLLEWQQDESTAPARTFHIVLEPRAGLAISTGLPQLYKAQLLLHSLHGPSCTLPISSFSYSTLRTLSMWILLSFLIFGCLSTFCMYIRLHHKSSN